LTMTDRTPAEIYNEPFDAWVKLGPRAIESLIEDRPTVFLAFIEAMRIDREGHTLQ
jgi:hypothetical protein